MPVTYKLHHDPDNGWSHFQVFADGRKLRAFTDLTGETAVQRFVELAQPHCSELANLTDQCAAAIQWNIANPDAPLRKKIAPCFTKLERLWTTIQRQAQIQDT